MSDRQDYDIRADHAHGPCEVVDVLGLARSVQPWFNQSLVQINDAVARVGVLDGPFTWHAHRDTDELFYVTEGRLEIEVEGHPTADLHPGMAYVVPRGVPHEPHAHGRAHVRARERRADRRLKRRVSARLHTRSRRRTPPRTGSSRSPPARRRTRGHT